MVRLSLVTLALFCLAAPPAVAGTVFYDNFDAENGGVEQLNYTGFAQWTVTTGTVDLIGNGGTWDLQPGHGLYVDMDGSTGLAGTMVSTSLALIGGQDYLLSFALAGNQRSSTSETVTASVELGLVSQSYSLGRDDPFQTFTLAFSPTSSGSYDLKFSATGGDNEGMLLDEVRVTSVPLPSSAWLGFGLMLVLAAFRVRVRRRQTA